MLQRAFFLILVLVVLLVPTTSDGRDGESAAQSSTAFSWIRPVYCTREHNIGNMRLAVTNHGMIGTGAGGYIGPAPYDRDCVTRRLVKSCEYPKDSRARYLNEADLWVGAVLGRDTLVSTGFYGGQEEFRPDGKPMGLIVYRSTLDPDRPEFEGAISEQDFIAKYADTCRTCASGYGAPDLSSHHPLYVEVTQRSMAWSYSYADDIVMLDFSVKNIGDEPLRRVYVGFHVNPDIVTSSEEMMGRGNTDDLCGFLKKQPALYLPEECSPDSDVVNVAWAVDNEGNLLSRPASDPLLNVVGTSVLRMPRENMKASFNWWGYNARVDYFEPQTRDNYEAMLKMSNLTSDQWLYVMMSNGEIDYDVPRVIQIGALDPVWMPPPVLDVNSMAFGMDVDYLLSFGPMQIDPGRSIPFTLAVVGGLGFHQSYKNVLNLPLELDRWYDGSNFENLETNAKWAQWIYDNPGIDTDEDGYSGEFTVCNAGNDSTLVCDTLVDSSANPDTSYVQCRWAYSVADTIWRSGDGVPDFRGAMPPSAPVVRVFPSDCRLRIVWNGLRSETEPDVFSREVDFEGYRVYIARDERRSSYSVVASYDRENWNRYKWDAARGEFKLIVKPLGLTELRCMYADSCNDTTWHPDQFTRNNPLVIPARPGVKQQIYFFEPQDFNRSVLANDPVNATTPIKKVYPDAPYPPVLNADSIRVLYPNGEDTLFLTEEGNFKYYEYEFTVEELLPSVAYWANVTVFDYGSPQTGLNAMETSPTTNPVVAMPMERFDFAAGEKPEVFVYPNPYRGDEDYRAQGFEGRGRLDMPVDRTRRIVFANLPPRCTISIFTLDGDRVREIKHDVDSSDPMSQLDYWDLITRNSQQPVSNLYYWTVEDDQGNVQIGKLVVIL